MWHVTYCPSERMEAMITRWFRTEDAARKFAAMWEIACIINPNGRLA